MITKVVLTPEARRDLAEITAWYRERSTKAAEEFLVAMGASIDRVETQPKANVVVDQTTGVRRALLRKFPQRVLYFIEGESIVVFAIMHHRRDETSWRERL